MAQIDDAKADYENGMKYREIAEKYSVTMNTVKSWRSRHGWTRGAPKTEKGAPKKQKPGAPKNNRYAAGNSGGSAPKRNKNAVTHGLFANWLPDETNELIAAMAEQSPADLIWGQIQIQYAAIIRAQKIMYVSDHDDETKRQTGEGFGDRGSDSYSFAFAWDKQATFLSAQSRAMTTLLGMIKQFTEMAPPDDVRSQQAVLMRAKVDKAQSDAKAAESEAKIAKIKADALADAGDQTETQVAKLLNKIEETAKEDDDGKPE